MVEGKELRWRIYAHEDPKTAVTVPNFIDAYKMVEKLETIVGEKIQQQTDN